MKETLNQGQTSTLMLTYGAETCLLQGSGKNGCAGMASESIAGSISWPRSSDACKEPILQYRHKSTAGHHAGE